MERVDHTYDAEDLVRVGRDIENVVLARAVRYHVEHCVLLNGKKTVVLEIETFRAENCLASAETSRCRRLPV